MASLNGNNGNEFIGGTFFADTISGAGGDDTIFGSFGNDLLSGETGTSAAGTGAPTNSGPIEFQVNTTSAGDQYHAQFTQLASGGFVATWITAAVAGTGPAQIMSQRFDAGGSPVGPEVQVSTNPANGYFYAYGTQPLLPAGAIDEYNFDPPTVTELVGGGYVVVWTNLAGIDVHARVFDAAGNPGTEFTASGFTSGPQVGGAVTALANGGFALTYSSANAGAYNTVLQTFDASGAPAAPASSPVVVNTYEPGDQGVSSVTQLDNGNILVTWTSLLQNELFTAGPHFAGNIHGQMFDANGAMVGPTEFMINTGDQADNQTWSKVVAITGGFVVVWQSFDPADITANEIRLQRYFNDGSTDGTMITVNTTTAGNQNLPEIAVLNDGGYVVVWQSELQDGSGYGIYQQRYNADGSLHGIETQVNFTTALDQRSATITALADGGWVVGYNVEGGLDGAGYGVFAVRFDANGVPVGQAMPYVAGNDYIDGEFGNDTIYGNAGDDTLLGSQGQDELYGGLGDDDLDGGVGKDLLSGGDGDDILNGGNGQDTLTGGLGDDELSGGNAADLMTGNDGADMMLGGSGNDNMQGGNGADTMEGGAHHDSLRGGNDADEMNGGTGNDTVIGDAGDDVLEGGSGHDKLYGGAGQDNIEGGQHNDVIFGGTENDVIMGEAGRDQLLGDAGADQLSGGNSLDTLLGGADNDVLMGDAGADWLRGDAGVDTLTGGAGADRFVFVSIADTGMGILADTITDFTHLVDRIDLSGFAGTFSFIGSGGFSGSQQVRYVAGVLQGDTDGDGSANFEINLTGNPLLTVADLFL